MFSVKLLARDETFFSHGNVFGKLLARDETFFIHGNVFCETIG